MGDKKSWIKYCQSLRNKVSNNDETGLKILLANFSETAQQKDIEARTPLIDDFYRVKINVKAWSEKEMKKIEKQVTNFRVDEEVFDSMKEDFDIPYWAFHSLVTDKLENYNNTFIYQLKGCNIHCPWCYVDDKSKNWGKGDGSRFFSINEIINIFEKERQNQSLNNMRPSGGEPTLVVEQWLEILEELENRGLSKEIYVQGDTNLTTGSFIDYLEERKQIEPNLLSKVGEFNNFGLLCSFKGTDLDSFLKATGMSKKYDFLEQERWNSFSKLTKAGIDTYPFIYDSNPDTLERFMEKGASLYGPQFYLKTWIVRLKLYGPEKERLAKIGESPETYQKKLDENFERSEEVMQDLIWKKFGINYKAVPRTGIELKVQD